MDTERLGPKTQLGYCWPKEGDGRCTVYMGNLSADAQEAMRLGLAVLARRRKADRLRKQADAFDRINASDLEPLSNTHDSEWEPLPSPGDA